MYISKFTQHFLYICIVISISFLICDVAYATSHQAVYTPLVTIPGFNPGGSIPDLVNALYTLLIIIGSTFAVLKIAFAGVKYTTSDVVSGKQQALSDIKGVLFGLILLLLPFIVLNTINPKLTNLNILERLGSLDQTEELYGNEASWRETGARGSVEDQQGLVDACRTSRGEEEYYFVFYRGNNMENSVATGCGSTESLDSDPGCTKNGLTYTCIYTRPGTRCLLRDTDCIERCKGGTSQTQQDRAQNRTTCLGI